MLGSLLILTNTPKILGFPEAQKKRQNSSLLLWPLLFIGGSGLSKQQKYQVEPYGVY